MAPIFPLFSWQLPMDICVRLAPSLVIFENFHKEWIELNQVDSVLCKYVESVHCTRRLCKDNWLRFSSWLYIGHCTSCTCCTCCASCLTVSLCGCTLNLYSYLSPSCKEASQLNWMYKSPLYFTICNIYCFCNCQDEEIKLSCARLQRPIILIVCLYLVKKYCYSLSYITCVIIWNK